MTMAKKVRDLMTPTPTMCESSTSLFDVATVMRDQGIGDVIVTQDGGLRGIVTDRDIVVRGVAEGRDPRETEAGSVVTGDLVTIGPEKLDEDAVHLMRERALKRILVVEDGSPVGILSLGDLAVEREPGSALADISEAPPNA